MRNPPVAASAPMPMTMAPNWQARSLRRDELFPVDVVMVMQRQDGEGGRVAVRVATRGTKYLLQAKTSSLLMR